MPPPGRAVALQLREARVVLGFRGAQASGAPRAAAATRGLPRRVRRAGLGAGLPARSRSDSCSSRASGFRAGKDQSRPRIRPEAAGRGPGDGESDPIGGQATPPCPTRALTGTLGTTLTLLGARPVSDQRRDRVLGRGRARALRPDRGGVGCPAGSPTRHPGPSLLGRRLPLRSRE